MGFNIRMLNGVGVGVVAKSKRAIKDGKVFDAYFPRPEFKDPILMQNGENEQTIDKLIPQIVNRYLNDTKKIAEVLKQTTKEATCKAIYDFLYNYVQYKIDEPHEEQIRRPARSWYDRVSGVDCDCYTTFISSVLLNLRIPHYLRMTVYDKRRGYQHIYVVVPKKGDLSTAKRSDYWVIDPVLDSFDTEKPFIGKRDKLIAPVNALNVDGVGVGGFPIRMLNGYNEGFNSRSNMVNSTIFYSPALRTWALKGIDGGYYIEGDKDKRYVEPLNGYGVEFINTGVGVNGWFKNIVGKVAKFVSPIASMIPVVGGVVSKGLSVAGNLLDSSNSGGSAPAPAPAPPAPVVAPAPVQAIAPQPLKSALIPVAPPAASPVVAKTDNTALLTSLITEKAKQGNNNTIMSLMTVDKGLKDKISDFSTVVGSHVDTLIKQGATTKEIADKSHEIAAKSIDILTSAHNTGQKNLDIASKSIDILASAHDTGKKNLDIAKTEAQAQEAFRASQEKTSQIQTFALLGIGLVVLYVAVKNNKSAN